MKTLLEELDLEVFKQTSNKIDYAKNNLEYIGQGSSRVVFDIGNWNVLKIASGKYGLNQNKQEVTTCNKYCKSGMFAKIIDHDPNYLWLIMEKVETWEDDDFATAIGLSESELMTFLIQAEKVEPTKEGMTQALSVSMQSPKFATAYKNITPMGKKLLNILFTLSSKYGVNDIDRYDHFGMTSNGKIVVLDYGVKL